jgi:hypothetical protein
VDVIGLFMALLSFRGISTPSLQAQGEQRRSSYFNNDRDIADEPSDPSFRQCDHNCGTLRPDVLIGREIPLTFREACNKIVHATHIEAETAGDPDSSPIGDTVILRGQRRDEAWVAHLSVVGYVRASAHNFDGV